MTRFSPDFHRGFATGIKAAILRPDQARAAAEWRMGRVVILPDRFWAFVTLIGAVMQVAGWGFVGFFVLLVGVAARC